MISINSNVNPVQATQPVPSKQATEKNEVPATKENVVLNPSDQASTGKYASGSSPATVSFAEPVEKAQESKELKRSYSPLVALFAVMMSLAGGNPNLLEPAQKELDGIMEIYKNHGENAVIGPLGSVSAPTDLNPFDKYTDEEKYPNKNYGKKG